jgi:autonomous glycyl radical cofactor GrcA
MRLITTALIGTCAMFAVERVEVGQLTTRQQTPTDKAVVFTLADINAESKAIQTRSSATVRLLDGGQAFSVNVLHRSGVEPATVHATKK